jgi:DNA-directed RNA polymerase specialized sigma24 family protein
MPPLCVRRNINSFNHQTIAEACDITGRDAWNRMGRARRSPPRAVNVP